MPPCLRARRLCAFRPRPSRRLCAFRPRPSRRRGFTLVEVLVTVAVLVIVLGLMANLARSVRKQASDRQTQALLVTLTHLMDRYLARHDGKPPQVTPLVPPPPGPEEESPASDPDAAALEAPDEAALRQAARANNRDIVRILRKEAGPADSIFEPVRGSLGEDLLLDAWGAAIVFMPQGHPAFGTALQDLPFFFSPGPDGLYRTLEDNVYSYEVVGEAEGGR